MHQKKVKEKEQYITEWRAVRIGIEPGFFYRHALAFCFTCVSLKVYYIDLVPLSYRCSQNSFVQEWQKACF